MAKKRVFFLVILLVFLSLILMINFTSASWFSDTFGKITGRAVTVTCYDTDPHNDIYVKGEVTVFYDGVRETLVYDECDSLTPSTIKQPYCLSDGTGYSTMSSNCARECRDGVCVTYEDLGCTDSDNGKNYYAGGITKVGKSPETISTLYDSCSGNNLVEVYCNPDGTRGEETYACEYKCEGYPSYCVNDPGCGSSSLNSCKTGADCTSAGGKWCSYPSNYTCQPNSCPTSTTTTSTSNTSNTTTPSATTTNAAQSTTSSTQLSPAAKSTETGSSGTSSYEERNEEDEKIIEEKSKFIDEKGHEIEIKIKTQTKIREDGTSIREEERIFKDKSGNEVKAKIRIEIRADGALITDEDREFVNNDGNLVKIRIKIESKDGSIKIKRVVEVEGAEIESDLEIAEEFEDDEIKLKANLSNGNKQDIKIMPDRASEIALEKLRIKNFTIELKEVGKDDDLKAVYVAEGNEGGKFLGIFKVKLKLEAQIDSETGEVINFDRPWWAFLVASIAEPEASTNEKNLSILTNQSNESINSNQT